ncbi:MAG: hypothetical protein FWG64_13780 [Firmicutes bacterium]|nr:hypothetical protein [Bacillota bacterium]
MDKKPLYVGYRRFRVVGLMSFSNPKWYLQSPAALLAWQAKIIALPFIAGLVLFLGIIFSITDTATSNFNIFTFFIVMTFPWMLISFAATLFDRQKQATLQHLKETGTKYECKILDLSHYKAVQIGLDSQFAVYLNLEYTDKFNQTQQIKSSVFMWKNLESAELTAHVYVDNSEKYAVEVSHKT